MLNLASLNPQQREAVESLHGPVLILAGAGTGKTRVITFRMANLMAHGVSAQNILGVTFTNKAAREMLARVSTLIPSKKSGSREKVEKPTICTFHSLCVRILRRHIELLGYKNNFVIYDQSEQLSAVKKIVSHISGNKELSDPSALLGLISRYKNSGELRMPVTDAGASRIFLSILNRYQSALKACNAVDFDDLILLTLRLFKDHPSALEACRNLYQFVMVDEYQDTNSSQFNLVHDLTKVHQNFCVVGDDDQSIYGWRGAEIANLLELEKYYPTVKVIKLEQNYRSTTTILSTANSLIKNNARRRVKNLWSKNGDGSKVILHTFTDDEDEAKTIAEEIEFARIAHRIPWADQAILFRTNLQSRPIETALRKTGVRYHLIGGQSFFDKREIKDFMAYLKVLINPEDDISLLRIANVPARGLSDVTMERLLVASQERKCAVYAVMKHSDVLGEMLPKTRENVLGFAAMIEELRAPLSAPEPLSLKTWAQNLLERVGYFEDLRRSEKAAEAGENRIKNLRELMETMDSEEEGSRMGGAERLQNFLETISLDNDRFSDKDVERQAVTLITMHSCKGLEFPHVYVVGIEEGLLPHARSKVEGTLDEERRLFYVAITRAMKTLTLSHCEGRRKYGQSVPAHPSQFLKELAPEFIEHASVQQRKPVTVNTGKSLFAAMRQATEG